MWEFDVRGRTGFFKILAEIHRADNQQYEVVWGERDRLLVKAVTHSPSTGKPFDVEMMLRFVLSDTGMTYRIDGGQYNIMPRSEGLLPPDWPVPAPKASTSLDHIARALSLQGRGYRVDRFAAAEVSLVAPVASWDQLMWIVSELDPGIKIVDDGSVVAVSKRGHEPVISTVTCSR